MKVEILPVWKKVTPALGDELMASWRRNQAIVDDATAAARATNVRSIPSAIQSIYSNLFTARRTSAWS